MVFNSSARNFVYVRSTKQGVWHGGTGLNWRCGIRRGRALDSRFGLPPRQVQAMPQIQGNPHVGGAAD